MKHILLNTFLFSVFAILNNSSFAQQGSLLFDGVDDKVVVPANTLFNSTTITCEAWINATQWKAQIYQGTIVGKDANNTSGYALRCGDNGKLSFVVGGAGGWTEATCGSIMQANVWTHVAGVYNNGTVQIFVNGNLVGSNTATSITSSNSNLLIGESPGFAGRVFKGYLDEVRVWNVARSQTDILSNMTVDLPNNQPGLVAYYKFNQITGTTAPNEISTTPNSIGTLTNFAANPWASGYAPPTTDISANALISPDVITFFSGSSRVRAVFKNTGLDTISNFSVGYKLNSQSPVIENVIHTLFPNEEFEYAFHQVVEGIDSANTLKIFTSLTTDNNSLNDTLRSIINKPANDIYNIPIFTNARHNFGAFGQSQHRIIPLPDNNSMFSQITMTIDLACPTSGCDPWDQPAKISLVKNAQTYELARFITPYGKACGPWTIDITDFKTLLQGSCDFASYIQVWGASGWLLNVNIQFLKSVSTHPYQKLTMLWETDNWVYGDPAISYDLPAQNILIDTHTQQVDLRITNTGHGQANTDNAAEFSQKTHAVLVNGNVVANHFLWKADCAQNVCSNQSGTWIYDRAGWCPGQAVDPFMVNLNSQFSAGQNLTVDYELEPYVNLLNTGYNGSSHTEPHYKIHAFLVEKSNSYIEKGTYRNAKAIRISNPTTNANLSTNSQVKVWIKNVGTVPMSGLNLYCFSNGLQIAHESPTLTIQPNDSTEYTFTTTDNFVSNTEYHISVLVDFLGDEASSDDVASVIINGPVIVEKLQEIEFDISILPNPNNGNFILKANHLSENTLVKIFDISGKQVFQKFYSSELLSKGISIESSFDTGFYILELKSNSSASYRKFAVR